MGVEYDPEKDASNRKKHEGVGFEEAKAVLLDPYALTHVDPDAQDEPRFMTLGMGAASRLLVVVWTLRGETPRLISAWKANQPQRKRYAQQF